MTFRREKIRLGLLRKKENECKALKIVEEMIIENVDREAFREAVSWLIPHKSCFGSFPLSNYHDTI